MILAGSDDKSGPSCWHRSKRKGWRSIRLPEKPPQGCTRSKLYHLTPVRSAFALGTALTEGLALLHFGGTWGVTKGNFGGGLLSGQLFNE